MKLNPLITKEQIANKVKEVSSQIQRDYEGRELVIVMVLKGALCLVADLIRELDLPLDVETVQCSSYQGKMRKELKVIGSEELPIEGRDVLLVDDIFDSGHTMMTLIEALSMKKPHSLKTCVLLYKRDVKKVSDYRPDYILFEIPNEFVVGYGLDFKERYRGLNGVYILR